MTKTEAIYRLKNMAWLYGSAEREQNIEAINMAIEALHREETEEKGYCHRIKPKELQSRPSGDLISRADAIKGIRKCKFESDMPSDWYKGMEDAQDIIENIPSADAIHSVGVFVPNMEMPKVCDYCLFHDSGWSWCKAKDKYCGDGKCPLIAVRGERND